MSKITNDGLTRSGTECFIARMATVGVKRLINQRPQILQCSRRQHEASSSVVRMSGMEAGQAG